MRTTTEIRAELGRLTARRLELWRELSRGSEPATTAEVARLTRSIADLWDELRSAQAHRRFGPREPILQRAERHRRLERELERRQQADSTLRPAA